MLELNSETGMPIAPRSFWEPIKMAHGDTQKFRTYLLRLDRNEMIEMYKMFKELELDLFSDEHLDHIEDNEEVVKETASWVVMQGEKYYSEVYNNPEKTPTGNDLFSDFTGEMVSVFAEKFNEWISVAAFPVKK